MEYYDWPGNYKIVSLNNNRSWLVDANTDIDTFSERVYVEWGYMPFIVNVVLVSEEWYEHWKDRFNAKGYLMASDDAGGGL